MEEDCAVCSSPYARVINFALLNGRKAQDIGAELPADAGLDVEQIRVHFQLGHLRIDPHVLIAVVVNMMAEVRAQELWLQGFVHERPQGERTWERRRDSKMTVLALSGLQQSQKIRLECLRQIAALAPEIKRALDANPRSLHQTINLLLTDDQALALKQSALARLGVADADR